MTLASTESACDGTSHSRASRNEDASSAPYQAEVEEGLAAAIAVLVDTSKSMREVAPGDSRPKAVVAREALEVMFDATEALVAKRPDFAVQVGVYGFSSDASAMRTARPDLYRAGVFRKYLLVVTDGENTAGRSPDEVAREIFQKSEHEVQIYFVAFDTSADRFGFLKDVQGDVIGAANGTELKKALDGIYRGRFLAEASTAGERGPALSEVEGPSHVKTIAALERRFA